MWNTKLSLAIENLSLSGSEGDGLDLSWNICGSRPLLLVHSAQGSSTAGTSDTPPVSGWGWTSPDLSSLVVADSADVDAATQYLYLAIRDIQSDS